MVIFVHPDIATDTPNIQIIKIFNSIVEQVMLDALKSTMELLEALEATP